jgi:AraC-like DNA-binding protein
MVRRVGLNGNCLGTPDLKIPEASLAKLLEASASAADCDTIGLLMGETWRLSDFGVLCLLLQHQPSLRDSLQALINYRHLLSDSIAIDVSEHGSASIVRCALITDRSQAGRQPMELAMAALMALCRHQLGADWQPQCVHFTHSAPTRLGVHQRVFGLNLTFNSDFDGLALRTSELHQHKADSDLLMAAYARSFIDSQPRPAQSQYHHAVLRALHHLMPQGQHSIQRIAQSLGMSARTLQRQLDTEGLSFQGLLNDLRKQRATQLVQGRTHSLTDVAHQLGFAETSVFSRWFRKHFGASPSCWQDQTKRGQ